MYGSFIFPVSMTYSFVPALLSIIHWQKENSLLINQVRKIYFINIIFSLTYEYRGFIRYIDHCTSVFIKDYFITTIKKLANTKKVVFKSINIPYIIDRR